MSQYIGKTISLISVTDNRYVGLLENIDSEKGTVTLRDVRCFGTEGRKNWGPDEIYPNPTVYQSVKFNGNDVKDLNILEVRLEDVQPVLHPNAMAQQQQQVQAPMKSQPQQVMPASQQVPPTQTLHPAHDAAQTETSPRIVQTNLPESRPQQDIPAAVAGYGVYAPSDNAAPLASKDVNSTEAKESSDNTRFKNERTQRKPRRQSHTKKIEIPSNDFDFETNNAKFAREAPEIANEQVQQPHETNNENNMEAQNDSFYNKKSSFFDTISTSAEMNTNMRWQEEKALNMDTFGQSSARPRFHSGRDNRGGRGRGRGGYRGNYRGNRGNYRGNRGGYHDKRSQEGEGNQASFQQGSSNIEF
ncbi:hypothetical protein KAFR_0C02340 [Kazachstania africana CBS 2517]|uniref:DFDF domain-containing protein n=1 Tax=Kazachstania africana (strain ATCC 22294 / BCRC 22015 / CBS 2517 / CECT 1963 / NBRC 1671 / NRRL Y-8276) TaxID=1071382 RepID=H2AS77_KAZAF|nr:hypothetical protein KAFR_0C02340 [Kazachstania africana CBS 2517]CCF57227.1 hypothetical protein KAFR_0C02340 [Kazachstania africana CBS 2517]